MGIFKWLCKKFSCKSDCQFNRELRECHNSLTQRIDNIHNYNLSIEDILKINKVLKKVGLKENSSLTI